MVALRFGLDVVAVTLLTCVYFCAFLCSFISCWRPCAQVLKRMCPKRRSTLCRGTPWPPIWPPEKLKTAIFWDHSLEMQETMGHVTCGTWIQNTGEPFQACWKSNTLWTIPSSTVETWHFSWKKLNAPKVHLSSESHAIRLVQHTHVVIWVPRCPQSIEDQLSSYLPPLQVVVLLGLLTEKQMWDGF